MTNTIDAVEIQTRNVKNDDGTHSPFCYSVHQHGKQLGFFAVDDYDTPEQAKAAARTLADKLEANPWVSPFVTHAQIIMADYGTAAKLRRFVLSLYNGHAFPCDLSDIAGMDNHHFKIVQEIMQSYHTLGENDKAMIKLAEQIKREFNVKPVRYAEEKEGGE